MCQNTRRQVRVPRGLLLWLPSLCKDLFSSSTAKPALDSCRDPILGPPKRRAAPHHVTNPAAAMSPRIVSASDQEKQNAGQDRSYTRASRGKENPKLAIESLLPSVISPPPEQLLRVRDLHLVGHRVVALRGWGRKRGVSKSERQQRTSGSEGT